jgi:protein TonB
MFCGACGKQLEEGAVFCGECGAKVQDAPASLETYPERFTGQDPEATLLLPQDPEEEVPVPAEKPEKEGTASGSWWKYAALLALLIVLCGVGGWYVVRYLASLRGAPPPPVAALPEPVQPAPAPIPAAVPVAPVPSPAKTTAPKPVKKLAPKKEPAKAVSPPKPVVQAAAKEPVKVTAPAPVPVSAPASPVSPAKREPLRVGGNVQESKLIRRIAPVYPEFAKRSRAEGTVILEVNVDEGGNVTAVRVVRGHPLLNDEAVRAVKQWKYSPTLLNGEAIPIIATVTVIFKLN